MSLIGIVLCGGFAKGAYQIGFMKALRKRISSRDKIYIAGSSVGAINGYALASDRIKEFENLWKSIDAKGLRSFIRLAKKEVIFDYIDKLADKNIKDNMNIFAECIKYPSMQLETFDLKNFSFKEIRQILKASISVPRVMKPVEISGKFYADAGVIDNMPIRLLNKINLDYIFLIHFDTISPIRHEEETEGKIIEFNFLEDQKIVSSSFDLSYESVSKMIEIGYNKTEKILDSCFANEDCQILNKKYCDTKLKINGDFVMNRLNRLTKAVTGNF